MHSFLIGREKPGTQSEVARLIRETLEQESQRQQSFDEAHEPMEVSWPTQPAAGWLCP